MNQEVAKDLLRIKAVQINTLSFFTWSSGLKSPIYCDNRLTMSYPNIRQKITNTFREMIYALPEEPDVIAGCATAGIPYAAWIANILHLPMIYVRSKHKLHGKENQIEGVIERGQRVIVIEDLISTGASSIQVARALREQGANVSHVLAIFTYNLPQMKQNFKKAHLTYQTITTYEDILDILENENQLHQADKQALRLWRHTF